MKATAATIHCSRYRREIAKLNAISRLRYVDACHKYTNISSDTGDWKNKKHKTSTEDTSAECCRMGSAMS